MAGTDFTDSMHVIPLGVYDMILGVQWMSKVSLVTFDYATESIEINWNGKGVRLQQTEQMARVQVILDHSKLKSHKKEAYFLVQLSVVEPSEQVHSSILEGIAQVINSYEDVFAEPSQLSPKRTQDHHIPLTADCKPVKSHPYRCPLAHREIEKLTREMLEAGIIRASTSPSSSHVLLVRKKDHTWRLVIDYRGLNSITFKNKFPIPVREELLAELQGSKVYTKLELRSGYHQIRLHEADIYKTAFKTHQGHFKFSVMPFGLTNAPASFQSLMNDVFSDFLRKFVLAFFDDILVCSSSTEEHVEHLKLIFDKLRSDKLFVKRSKCAFAQSQIEYLDHIISYEGVAADKEKIQAMIDWLVPRTVKALRGFLGLSGYYRRFVQTMESFVGL